MNKPDFKFSHGDRVKVVSKGRLGTVTGRTPVYFFVLSGHVNSYRVALDDGRTVAVYESELVHAIAPAPAPDTLPSECEPEPPGGTAA